MKAREVAAFRQTVWDFYREHGRHDLPWRVAESDGSFDPYKILVSEIMLQQTQVPRVIPKYQEFLAKFPNVQILAAANLGEVLAVWNGLGYNRRAKFLWQAAQKIEQSFSGTFPRTVPELQKLPGVGPNTAGAIIVYSFNQPEIFVETNIRTVFIHHFFQGQTQVSDKDILLLVAKTLPDEERKERRWFWALMDYGNYLKQTVGNVNQASKSYAKQSKFAGSRRQLRGAIIRVLLEKPRRQDELMTMLPDERLATVLAELTREGLIRQTGKRFSVQ